MKALKDFGKAYLDLNPKLDSLIKALVEKHSEDIGDGSYEGTTELVECRPRDGFIPFSDNCGGWEFTFFQYLNGGTGRFASKEANAQVEHTFNQAQESAFEELEIPKDTAWDSLTEEQEEKVREYEDSYLSDATLMLQLRIMYGGVDEKGVHTAWVSACINWEAPYHRSHISWMPKMKCEHAKEIEVKFKNLREAKSKLTKAILKAKKSIF